MELKTLKNLWVVATIEGIPLIPEDLTRKALFYQRMGEGYPSIFANVLDLRQEAQKWIEYEEEIIKRIGPTLIITSPSKRASTADLKLITEAMAIANWIEYFFNLESGGLPRK